MNYNQVLYTKTINTDKIYKQTISEFTAWLANNYETDNFGREIERYLRDSKPIEQLYAICYDYGIPIVMVKWFTM